MEPPSLTHRRVYIYVSRLLLLGFDQRHILRDRRPSLLDDRDKGIEIMYGEEKNILYWATRAAKAEQKSPVLARQVWGLRNMLDIWLYVL